MWSGCIVYGGFRTHPVVSAGFRLSVFLSWPHRKVDLQPFHWGPVKNGVSEGHILSAGSFHVMVEKVSSKQDWDLLLALAAVCGLLLRGTHACRKRLTLTDMLHQAECVIFLSHGSLRW